MKKTILLLIVASLAHSCSNDNFKTDPQLPPETQVGANTFGCIINGKVLIPRDGSGTFGGSDKAVTLWGDPTGNNQYADIDVHDFKSDKSFHIKIHIVNLHQIGVGNYTINQANGERGIDAISNNGICCRIFEAKTNSYQYYYSYENSGFLIITRYDFLPYEKSIMSGSFSCKVRNSINPDDVIEIKQGRFDFDTFSLPNKTFP